MYYDKYFGRGQKVFLINISDDRDQKAYNSITGQVVSCLDDRLVLKTAYHLFSGDSPPGFCQGMQFKLTTEALGMGVQLRAELLHSPAPDSLILKPLGDLSVYQRRQSPRLDTVLPVLHITQKSSLESFRKEWQRIAADLHKPNPPRLKLQNTDLNLSMGGIRLSTATEPANLSLVMIDLKDGHPPVSTVAELVWQAPSPDSNKFQAGHRFLDILKEDQKRISKFVEKTTGSRHRTVHHKELLDSI
ncbi:MAG: PilZ domain-containing protein [Trichlorobacter sp.]|nr:PilZ domain-containing protein [Trichlorobacter sp.]